MATPSSFAVLDQHDAILAKDAAPARARRPLRQGGFRTTFWSPYEQHRDRVGQPFTVLGLKQPGADFDPQEVGEMYQIRFRDGTVIDAWPEEVELVT